MDGLEGNVPILEITDENFESMWPGIKKSIQKASFVAVDCELSGLGDRSKLNYPEVDVRYENTSRIAQEYSIVSLGLSCFNCFSVSSVDVHGENGSKNVKSQNYCVQTFNILTLSLNPYTVEPKSLKFLATHGFDFNKQYTHGLPFGIPTKRQNQEEKKPNVGDIFKAIVKYRKPIILHNGYIDLLFLYQSFYTELPKKSDIFAADLNEMFPSGIYDTKYITEFHETFPATFLEYIFKKMQLGNFSRIKRGLWHVRLNFPPYPDSLEGLNWHPFNQVYEYSNQNPDNLPLLCNSYKFHGWCPQGNNCKCSHDINRIVRELDSGRKRRDNPRIADTSVAHIIHMKKQDLGREPPPKRQRARQQRKRSNSNSDSNCSSYLNDSLLLSEEDGDYCTNQSNDQSDSIPLISVINKNNNGTNNLHMDDLKVGENINNSTAHTISAHSNFSQPNIKVTARCSGHRAGFDAFMTGYIFACNVTNHGCLSDSIDFTCPHDIKLDHLVDRVYLIGKEFPFLVRSSSYSKTSNAHDSIINRIRCSHYINEDRPSQ